MILSLLACSSEATPESPDIESQIDDYTKAIELEPNNGKAYNNRGGSYYNLGEYEKAINDYYDKEENKNQLYNTILDEKLFIYLNEYFINDIKEKSTDELRSKRNKK